MFTEVPPGSCQVTSPGIEKAQGLDFAQIYRDSPLCAKNQAQIDAECIAPPGTQPLCFEKQFAVSTWMQFK